MSGFILIQRVCHSDGIPERTFWKMFFEKKDLQTIKKHGKLPSMQSSEMIDASQVR